MTSKADRKMCGTCMYWNGSREGFIDKDKPKVAIFDECGVCECFASSMSGHSRRKELSCKEYLQWYDPNKDYN